MVKRVEILRIKNFLTLLEFRVVLIGLEMTKKPPPPTRVDRGVFWGCDHKNNKLFFKTSLPMSFKALLGDARNSISFLNNLFYPSN